jgi:hypothetical protein
VPTSVAVAAPADSDLERSYLAGSWRTREHEASYRLPTLATCELVAALADRVPGVSDPRPGGLVRRFELMLTPGSVRIRSSMIGEGPDEGWALDLWDAQLHRYERDSRQRITAASLRNAGASTGRKGAIVEWSRKSRLNMARVLASLDWAAHLEEAPAGWRPQMLTLTLPREWQQHAPTGADWKHLFHTWLKRWRRYFEQEWAGSWKSEFQGRGAPHLHLYGNAPTGLAFRRWLSASWAHVVWGTADLEDLAGPMRDGRPMSAHALDHWQAGTGVDWREGVRGTDPRSIALYFLGRSVGHNLGKSKEYQHRVPDEWQRPGAGPGRFWGHRGVPRVEVVREVDDVMYLRLRRLVRRYDAAKSRTRVVRRGGRSVRRRATIAGQARYQGYTLLNPDAPAFLAAALRWEALGAGDGDPPPWVDPVTGERLRGPKIVRACGPVGILP